MSAASWRERSKTASRNMNEPTPRRGEVWWVNFSPTVGREQYGDRPALIVSTDRFNESPAELVIAVPLTTTRRGIPWHIEIPRGQAGLRKTSFALCEMVRSISKERLRRRSGQVQASTLEAVEDRLRILLDL